MDVGQLVADIVGFGCSKIHNWFVESEAELEDLTILAHRCNQFSKYFCSFLYVTPCE